MPEGHAGGERWLNLHPRRMMEALDAGIPGTVESGGPRVSDMAHVKLGDDSAHRQAADAPIPLGPRH